jgi:aspartate racemase
MHIGLIGGIGPAATEFYYRALIRSHAAAGHRLDLTIAHADVQEMVRNMDAGQPAAQAAVFARYIDQLKAAGCDVAALTSMGGHFCIRELEKLSSLPLINAIPEMDRHFASLGVRCVGVLGSRAVMESKLYGVSSVEVIAPSPDELPTAHATYVAMAMAGAATDQQRQYFELAGRKLLQAGAEVVVLGGTDLFLAFEGRAPDYPIVDSALVHAEAITRVSLGRPE